MGKNKSHQHDSKKRDTRRPSHAIPASSVDWMPCTTCKGKGQVGFHACPDCLGTGGAYVTR